MLNGYFIRIILVIIASQKSYYRENFTIRGSKDCTMYRILRPYVNYSPVEHLAKEISSKHLLPAAAIA